jgi:aspartate racemase
LPLRKLGVIGGMSWVSTRTYYEEINRLVQRRTDKRHSAPLLIESLDFAPIYRLQYDAGWQRATEALAQSARTLEAGGAGALLIAANSMHKVYDQVAEAVSIPIFHIAESVGERMAHDGVEAAALFGTRNVMTESFYRRRLVAHGVDLLPPDMANVEALDRIIYEELMVGKASRDAQRGTTPLRHISVPSAIRWFIATMKRVTRPLGMKTYT